MDYVTKRGNHYYYYRRTPKNLLDKIGKRFLKVSLKTDSKKLALRKAIKVNAEVEAYWNSLLQQDIDDTEARFNDAVNLAKHVGFNYTPIDDLVDKDIQSLIERVQSAGKHIENQQVIEALLGTAKQPEVSISRALDIFWSITKDRIMNKSEKQIRKWRNPRIKAIKNAITVIGDKPIESLIRQDVIDYRDWWIDRIENEGKSPNTANKDLVFFKNIIETVGDHLNMQTDFQRIFKKLTLSDLKQQTKKPFEAEYIRDVFLSNVKNSDLNEEAKAIILILVNTGARPSEITNLEEDDIKLDAEIPHIKIRPNTHHQLKTVFSERNIPLLGCSLEAMKNFPSGFPRYQGKTDSFSNLVNKYFRTHKLLPSAQHSLYSLRHGFQDRLTRTNINDRMQTELMGHKFNRPLYGEGPTLQQKYDCLKEISF